MVINTIQRNIDKTIKEKLEICEKEFLHNRAEEKELLNKLIFHKVLISDTDKKDLAFEQIRKDLDEENNNLSSIYYASKSYINENFRISKSYEDLISDDFYKIFLLQMELECELKINTN